MPFLPNIYNLQRERERERERERGKKSGHFTYLPPPHPSKQKKKKKKEGAWIGREQLSQQVESIFSEISSLVSQEHLSMSIGIWDI